MPLWGSHLGSGTWYRVHKGDVPVGSTGMQREIAMGGGWQQKLWSDGRCPILNFELVKSQSKIERGEAIIHTRAARNHSS